MDLLLLLILLSLLGYFLYKYGTKNFDYFEKIHLPFSKPTFFIGNSGDLVMKRKSMPIFIKEMYDKFPKDRVFGYFDMGKPNFFIRDPELLKQLTIKDFDYFADHTNVLDEKVDVLFGNSLLSLTGQKWRDMRSTLSPAFTGNKLRQMFDLIKVCGDDMTKHFVSEMKVNGALELEMKDVFTRLANDVIATVAFGIEVNSFKCEDNIFLKMAKQLTNFSKPLTPLIFMGYFLFPRLMRYFNIRLIDGESSDYFYRIIEDALAQREQQQIVRLDMINLLLNVKRDKIDKAETNNDKNAEFSEIEQSVEGVNAATRQWNDKEIAAQCFIFFVAGYDTISTALSFLVYELAVNQDVQEKLFNEILTNDGELTYDSMQDMTYMDMVIAETLRKWPPVPNTERMCVKDYKYDDGKGLRFTIPQGTGVWLPIYAIHHDPNYFTNPSKFDPERFSEEQKHNLKSSAYVPFGSGPRNCIGSRMALMEMKIVLYYLLKKFSFQPMEKTQIPLQYAKSQIGLSTEKGVWLQMRSRQ